MIGLFLAVIVFNLIAFKTNKNLSRKQIAHIWSFTTAFQMSVDTYVDVKYHAYWYFTKGIDWWALPANTILLPPVNMMFLNWYPFKKSIMKQIRYVIYGVFILIVYEVFTLLPKPWGYFYYGWWNLGYSVIVDPLLLLILVFYYKRFVQ
jgi:uncharacterized protein YcfL